jgi:Ca2+-binding RTX toxin-like protein
MTWQAPLSQTAQVNLGTVDDAFIASGVTIATGVSAAIFGTGSGHDVLVYGTVTSAQNQAISLGTDPGINSAQNVAIKAGGHVQALGPGANALSIFGHDSMVVNQGLVASQDGHGIFMSAFGAANSTLTNSGTISAANDGVLHEISSTETLVLVNSGAISGGTASYAGADNARDLITNMGSMTGDVALNGGNDLYNGAQGLLVGKVFGGDGIDTIIGGKENDVFSGDAGNDTLAGGLGKDMLTGGADNDIFDFNSIKDSVKGASRDQILDFVHGQGDRIDLSTIDANTHTHGSQAFHSHGTHHVYGELRYKNHILSGDVNGDGHADFEIHVNAASLAKGDFVL